ncbi:MAG: DNA primase [Gammaproteobacteria bacterium]|nr:DNA primase [Gammaproteobacteria bacterium]
MAGLISKSFIADLLARVDIVDVVDPVVKLKKSGKDFQGLCPFHQEKTPSFTVSQEKQFYHCFGCGAHGSAVNFLMQQRGLAFTEAIEELASVARMEVVYESGGTAPREDFSGLYGIMVDAQALFAKLLKEHPTRERAVAYLKGRGLTGKTAKHFGIGYAPPAWDTVVASLGTSPARIELLEQAGLVLRRDGGGHYDRFRDRIMFPIHDRRGRVVGFGGRVIDNGEPKYLNSPETPIFHKRQEVYGLYFAKAAKPDSLLLVEGYMDVVSLIQHGVDNAVATLGTSTTAEQLEQLFRVTPEVVCCFDGDNAGRKAAWRALEAGLPLLSEGRKLGFRFMPQGHDPDSLVRAEGPAVFRDPAGARSLSDFLFQELGQQTDLSTIEGRARLIAQARPLIGKLPQGAYRHLLAERLAELAQTSLGDPERLLSREYRPATAESRQRPSGSSRRSGVPSRALRTLVMLINRPELVKSVADLPLSELPSEGENRLLAETLTVARESAATNTGELLERLRDVIAQEELSTLLGTRLTLPEDLWEAEFRGAIEGLLKMADRKFRQSALGSEVTSPKDLPQEVRDALRRGRVRDSK